MHGYKMVDCKTDKISNRREGKKGEWNVQEGKKGFDVLREDLYELQTTEYRL